jgi:rod shape-determining protein MreC
MKWISPLLSKEKALRTSLILAGISLTYLLLPHGTKGLMSSALQGVYSPFYGLSNRVTDLFQVYEENLQLKDTITHQMLHLAMLGEERKENSRLRSLLGFRETIQYDLVAAELITLDPKRRQNAVIVETRYGTGVSPDLPVVNTNGLVGKTSSVTSEQVSVELLTSPNCRVAARDANTRTLGIIRWEGGKLLRLDNVSYSDSVSEGDTIITSGLGGLFPESLPIGIIDTVYAGESPFFRTVEVRPFVDFGALDELMILKQSGF